MNINKRELLPRFTFESIFILKVLASFFIYWLYTYYYPIRKDADIYKYFDDGKVLFELGVNNPIVYLKVLLGSDIPSFIKPMMNHWSRPGSYNVINTNITMIKLHSLFYFISNGSYLIHGLFFTFLAYLGIIKFYNSISKMLSEKKIQLLILCLTLPSFVLWSSSALKESLLTGIFFYLTGFILSRNKISIKNVFLIGLGSFLVFIAKPYFAIALIPLIPFYFIKKGSNLKKYSFFLLIAFMFLWLSNILMPKVNIVQWIFDKQSTFLGFSKFLDSGSKLNITPIEPNIWSLIISTPNALFNVMVKPFIWESSNPLFIFTGLENIVVIICILIALFFKRKDMTYKELNILYFFSIISIVIFILIGLTTPVMGAIVRYKSPVLPLILVSCLILIDLDKIKKYVFKKDF